MEPYAVVPLVLTRDVQRKTVYGQTLYRIWITEEEVAFLAQGALSDALRQWAQQERRTETKTLSRRDTLEISHRIALPQRATGDK